MRSLSNLSMAFIIAAALILLGNILNRGLCDIAAMNMGFMATSSPTTQTIILYWLSGVLFVFGIALAVVSIAMERKKNKQ